MRGGAFLASSATPEGSAYSPLSHHVGEGGRGGEGAPEAFPPSDVSATSQGGEANTPLSHGVGEGGREGEGAPEAFPTSAPLSHTSGRGGEGEPSLIFFTTAYPVVRLKDGALNLTEIPMPALQGRHNLENALAAAHVAAILGCTVQQLRDALATFNGAPHRMELVGEWEGVRYINNSMCTNADALEKSLQATPKPCIVIAGGVDKNDSIQQIAESIAQHARFALLIGRDGQAIGDALTRLGYTRWEYAETLENAVREAKARARAGETVVLAPGCASFDQFRNFAHRGEEFKRIVAEVNG